MKRILTYLAAFCCVVLTTKAQTAPAAPAPNAELLERQTAASQRRVDQLMSNIRDLDARIEKRISKAVDGVKPLGDSKESGTRVARIKAEVIDFLRKQTGDYSRRRAQLRAELDNPRRVLAEDTLNSDIAKIDARIDRRVEQIIGLGGSFAAHKEYDKYTVNGTGWYGHTEYRVNEDWKQDRRNTRRTGEEKGKLFNAIDENVKRLEATNRALKGRLQGQSPASAARIQADITRNEALIASLNGERNTLFSAGSDSLRLVGSKEATQIEARLKQAGADARSDQFKLISLYNELNQERARLQSLTTTLATQKKTAAAN
jgi:hypothetical protein